MSPGSAKNLATYALPLVMAEITELRGNVPSSAWTYTRRSLAFLDNDGRRPTKFDDLSADMAEQIRRACDDYALAFATRDE
jgi:hypothetical protein